MGFYKIIPLHLGTITRPKSNMILDSPPSDERGDFPLLAYYLKGERGILVDTGGNPPDDPYGQKAQPYTRAPKQELPNALRAAGVAPADIEIVILTHLHWDHAANNHLLPNARFYCQRAEYDFIQNPTPEASMGYEFERVRKTPYELVDGDAKLFDSVSVLLTPGHTKGGQCVVVDTAEGKVVLTGDLVTLRESYRMHPPRPNGLCVDREAMLTSLRKVKAVSERILPGHDPSVLLPGGVL
ncbi:MAG: N-acyl homoserine lactonase family protein [Clostridiales Family XIII bacterium]|jgi:glyoxylase-like metal-dependent hydrolase (beta-lactamase superfamily II)|nr:N-acyl homoserine lactonase family protein [Clostridiales Family XIII bacterium]